MSTGHRRPRKTIDGYTISAVAERYGVHPQTLRLYEREGLLKPFRSVGNTRYYSDDDLERLEMILTLTRDLGVNLAGVEVILNLREQMGRMQEEMTQFLEAVQSELNERIAERGRGGALVPRSAFLAARRAVQEAAVIGTVALRPKADRKE
jgi:MerR family transcriptional regulator/heat shock protein HspR